MLKLFVRHGMVVDEIGETTSSKQSKWLEKCINLNTQKQFKAINEFEKNSTNYLIMLSREGQWKTYETVLE